MTKKYIKAIGNNGMPALDTPVSFKVLNKASTHAAQQIENKHTNGLIDTHYKVVKTFFGQTNTSWVQLKKNRLIFLY